MMRILLLLLMLISFAPSAQAENKALSYTDFANIPVLHEGRVIPLDIFAATTLETLSGRSHIGTSEASDIFADIIFNPADGAARKIFGLTNETLRTRLKIETPRRALLSLNDLESPIAETRAHVEALLTRDPASFNKDERALLALHSNVSRYIGLMRSLSLILPLNVDVPAHYGEFEENANIAYLDLARFEARIMADLKSLVSRKGEDIARYSGAEKKTALLAYNLQSIRAGGAVNDGLKIMPLKWDAARAQEFQSPWQLILSGQGSPENADYLGLWKGMAMAHRADDAVSWHAASGAALSHITARLAGAYPQTKFTLERLYHNAQPYSIAAFLYGAALLLLLAYALRGVTAAAIAAKYTLLAGAVFHGVAIAMRVMILDRPPVGTLYESVLFVAFICAALGFILSRKNTNALYIFCGSFSALLLLLIAPFISTGSQTLGVLSAVLNTNFWLATHVLCITIGYGVAVMAALCAHGYLIARGWPTLLPKMSADSVLQITYRFSLAALLFTAVGTILGGIWADQSWGRFWGWDPKENGALLIVIWLIWLQHGRLSGHVNAAGFAVGIAALNIIVALAWFGVNLLSVGLHSYGFTSGLAWGLCIFCMVQLGVIGALYLRTHLLEKT